MNAPYSLCNSLFLPANVPGFVFFPLVCNNKWKSRAERMMCLNERKIYERCGVSNEGVLLVALRFLQMNRITIAHADPFFHEAADPYGVVNFTLFHSGKYGTHLLQAWSKAIQRLTSHMLYTIEKSVDDLPSDLRSITDKLDRTLILSLTLSVRFVLALFCPCIHRWLVCLFRIRNVNSSTVTISIFFFSVDAVPSVYVSVWVSVRASASCTCAHKSEEYLMSNGGWWVMVTVVNIIVIQSVAAAAEPSLS